jgi:glycosyltransferase involved in cell wall biosynthesis
VLAVIPAFNEEDSIGGVIDELRRAAPEVDAAVVVDVSTDRTEEVARSAGARVLRLPVRMGIGGAVRTGFRYAHEMGYGMAIQLDGDGQHDPGEIPALLQPLRDGEADLVIGSRFINREGFQSGHARRLGIRFFSGLTTLFTGLRLTDITSGFRAVGPGLLAYYARAYPVEYPDAEAILLAVYGGFRVREVPAVMRPRQAGRSSVTPLQSVYYPMKVLVSMLATVLGRSHYRRQAAALGGPGS